MILKAVFSWLLITFKDEGSTIVWSTLDNLFQCLANLKTFFLMFKLFSCISTHTHCLSSFHCLLPGGPWLHFLYSNTSRNQTLNKISLSLLFSRLNCPVSFRLSTGLTGSNPSTTYTAIHRINSTLSSSLL